MAKGYYLVVEDETTCGGIIIEGDTTHTLFGRAVAREEDRVTCGKHPGTYFIIGHIPGDKIHGRNFAGTLHSKSSCPCEAEFIPSMVDDTYDLGSEEKQKEKTSFTSIQYDYPNTRLPSLNNESQCTLEFPLLYSGVFLWTETLGTGHAFVSIHIKGDIYLFTYGRYDQEGFSPVGEGVLIKYHGNKAHSYFESELYKMSANVYQITDVDEGITLNVFNKLWNSSEKKPYGYGTSYDIKESGRIINKYDLTGSNCTTISVNGLKESGTTIFSSKLLGEFEYSEDFIIPWSLNNHLTSLSKSLDVRVIDVSHKFRELIKNKSGHAILEGNGVGNEAAGVLGKSYGLAGNASSGISTGTIGGILGSSND